jgi:hypothetical protein
MPTGGEVCSRLTCDSTARPCVTATDGAKARLMGLGRLKRERVEHE